MHVEKKSGICQQLCKNPLLIRFSAKYHELTKSTNALIHLSYILLYLLWYIQNTYILINHELTQDIYIILANTVVFWSQSLMHH